MLVNAELYVKDLPGQLVGSLEPISVVDGNILGVVHNRERIVNHRICINITFEIEEEQLERLKQIWKSKDIIISGGENISTIEVEAALFAHPAVAEAAVVGRPDEYWGETPCAFVTLKEGKDVGAEEVMAFCRARLPRYMAPRTVVFVAELPKTATGKVQKFALREQAKAMGSISGSSSKKPGGSGVAGTRSKL